ncbi:MAG: DUF6402 family protein [Gammaproteobacteria bacterium]
MKPEVQLFGLKWTVKEAGFGCRPSPTQTSIEMLKNPPPIFGVAPPPPPPSAPPSSNPGINGNGAAKGTTHAGAAGIQRPSLAQNSNGNIIDKKENCPVVPPFDMLDLPTGMRAMGFTKAAYCADRWFRGQAHVIKDGSADIESLQFLDTDTFKLDWILSFGLVKRKFDALKDADTNAPENIYNNKSREALKNVLKRFVDKHNNSCPSPLSTWSYSEQDIQKLHRDFQFQRIKVTMVDVLGGILEISQGKIKNSQIVNDLAASLANFYFYAAVAHATVRTRRYMRYGSEGQTKCTQTTVEVSHIYVYAKDVYSFNDETQTSQYLGHWNRYGVIISAESYAASLLEKEHGSRSEIYLPPVPKNLDRPLDTGNSLLAKQVYYPVRNKDFETWRHLKNRGGDFAIFSDTRKIKLAKPITIDLDEICEIYRR